MDPYQTKGPALDLSAAVYYHDGGFPPPGGSIDLSRIISPLASAAAALGGYDEMLKGMHNSEILMAPLRNQEAVISSRMEGTVSTIDEVLKVEADDEDGGDGATLQNRNEAIETFLYARAMRAAYLSIQEGYPLTSHLLRNAHRILLSFGRGASEGPGNFKSEQNYLADRNRKKVLFVPIAPERLADGMDRLFTYISDGTDPILLRTAIAHLEFEALHPFKDGNGRIGRMLITLMLWKHGAISAPHFYVSGYFEENKDQYIDTMRQVSATGDWTDWAVFFLTAVESQAQRNIETGDKIRRLYDEMRQTIPDILSSKYNTLAIDFLFQRPVFRNNVFTKRSGMPEATAHRFAKQLVDAGILETVEAASGRRAALYRFERLLALVRT
ncbi:MAG: Fic/DOC family N-terminal domain-containing protein [Pseudomonadota bacterium]